MLSFNYYIYLFIIVLNISYIKLTISLQSLIIKKILFVHPTIKSHRIYTNINTYYQMNRLHCSSTLNNNNDDIIIGNKLMNNNDNNVVKPLVIEIVTTKTIRESRGSIRDDQQLQQQQQDDINNNISYETIYNDDKEDRVSTIVDNRTISQVLGLITNPLALLLFIYTVLLGYNKVVDTWNNLISLIFKRKGKDNSSNSNTNNKGSITSSSSNTQLQSTVNTIIDLPFQIYECEICQMQMRPAKGRAEKIFSRERFRCARCGSKASAYFNIDDMNDTRAVARMERLQQEEADDYGDDDE